MFKLTVRYARYVLSALATIGFGLTQTSYESEVGLGSWRKPLAKHFAVVPELVTGK